MLNLNILSIFSISFNALCLQECVKMYEGDGIKGPLTLFSEVARSDHLKALNAAQKKCIEELDKVCYFQILYLLACLSLISLTCYRVLTTVGSI